MVSEKTIGRFSLYRRVLHAMQRAGAVNVFSHQLAADAGVTAAQVRRDVMALGYCGSPNKGYNIVELISSIAEQLDASEPQGVALVGIGKLGRAIMDYFAGQRPKLTIAACFDTDPAKIGRVISGCRCYSVAEMDRIIPENDIRVAVITVPGAVAQETAERLVRAGVRGILNYAPMPLRLPSHVYVEQRDMTMALERVAYFARRLTREGKDRQ